MKLDQAAAIANHVVLEKFRIGLNIAIGGKEWKLGGFKASAEVHSMLDYLSDQMIFHMRAYLLKGQTLPTETVLVPVSWWDHVKFDLKGCRRLPAWIKQRINVKYTTHALHSEVRVCPHYSTALEKSHNHFEFLVPERFDVRRLG